MLLLVSHLDIQVPRFLGRKKKEHSQQTVPWLTPFYCLVGEAAGVRNYVFSKYSNLLGFNENQHPSIRVLCNTYLVPEVRLFPTEMHRELSKRDGPVSFSCCYSACSFCVFVCGVLRGYARRYYLGA